MTEEEEREHVRQVTDQNRKAVPETVVRALANMSITLDDVLRMTRQDFDAVNRKLYEQNISDADRTYLIDFKHDSMTHAERLVFIEPTDAEWDEIEKEQA